MKKQKQDFADEYGVYKRIGKEVVRGEYAYEYVLVKRGFYNLWNAMDKARLLHKADTQHAYVTELIKDWGMSFKRNFMGEKVVVFEARIH